MNLCFPLQLPMCCCVRGRGCRLRCSALGSRATVRASLQATRFKLRAETLMSGHPRLGCVTEEDYYTQHSARQDLDPVYNCYRLP